MPKFDPRLNKSVGTWYSHIVSFANTAVRHFSTAIMVYNVIVCHYDGKITFTARRIMMGENTRTIQLHFYVTEKENEIIKERMKVTGIINLSHYLRKMAISGYIINLDMTDIKNVSRLLSSCSNNLNQYVRLAHENGSIYETDIEDLNERLNEVTKQFKVILKGFVKLMSVPTPQGALW